LVQNSGVSELITGAVQVQNGVKRLLEGNELLTPLSVSADKLAWITVSSPVAYVITAAARSALPNSLSLVRRTLAGARSVGAAGVVHLQDRLSNRPVPK
jgi:hypothetical protein